MSGNNPVCFFRDVNSAASMNQSVVSGEDRSLFRNMTPHTDRWRYSQLVRGDNRGYFPVVVSSSVRAKHFKFYRKFVMHGDHRVADLCNRIRSCLDLNCFEGVILSCETSDFDTFIPCLSDDISILYKSHRNDSDKILYFIVDKVEAFG